MVNLKYSMLTMEIFLESTGTKQLAQIHITELLCQTVCREIIIKNENKIKLLIII